MLELFAVSIVGVGVWLVIRNIRKSKVEEVSSKAISIPPKWKIILSEKVAFYNALSLEEKLQFEQKIQQFFANHKITGVQVEIDIVDRLLVASSASILTFEFPNWEYSELDEVLIYPNSFNSNFETAGPDRTILGMVGTGYMDGKMILCKQALHHGFSNTSDKKNVAIHEFVHLIDKEDGVIDGIPSVLLENQYSIPWMELAREKMNQIHQNDSDINPYGGTNKQEFFAVATEYFFERPHLMKKKHPKLHELMVEVFDQDLTERKLSLTLKEVGRNDPCPCGSGEKYKRCCLD